MAGLFRLRTFLSHFTNRTQSLQTQLGPKFNVADLRCSSTTTLGAAPGTKDAMGPALCIHPETSLSDEMLDIQASGLRPGQLVILRAQVYTENGKYRFLSTAQYRAGEDGTVKAQRDPSLGGSYEGVEPMGLIWGAKPAPEVAHKHPRLVKWDVTKPFRYTIELLDGSAGQAGQGEVLASKIIERRYLADYVEQIPVNTGLAEGMLYMPRERGLSDPLPFIIDIRGLLTRLVVDRAAILASHGFAVFAFDYFLPRRMKSNDENVYLDGQAFLDIINFVKEHPRLDETRIGVTSSCYGGSIMMHSVTRLNLPVKCLVGAGFSEALSIRVGFTYPDGRKLEPYGPLDQIVNRSQDERGSWWINFTGKMDLTDRDNWPGDSQQIDQYLSLAENLSCPFLMFTHGDDQHIPSKTTALFLKDRIEKAGKGHLVELCELPGTGHFLETPYQAINTVSSLFDPTSIGTQPKMFYTHYGGDDTAQSARDQQLAWRKIVNFFRKHLEVKEMYRKDWISD